VKVAQSQLIQTFSNYITLDPLYILNINMIIGAEKVNTVKFVKLKSGKIVRQIEEQYLRKDIPCGISNCPLCDRNESKTSIIFLFYIDCNLNVEFKSSAKVSRDVEMKMGDNDDSYGASAVMVADKIYIVDH